MGKPDTSRGELASALITVLVQVSLGVLANLVTGWNPAVLSAFVVLTLLLLGLTYLRVRGVPPAASGWSSRARRLLGSRWWPALSLSVVTWIILAVAVALVGRPDETPVAKTPACAHHPGEPGVATAAPPSADGLTFCPVLINDGRPITGSFALAGQVLGPADRRNHLLMVLTPDPRTCDAFGYRPKGESFVVDDYDPTSADGSWSYIERFGDYAEGVLLARTFSYVSAPPATISRMKDDAARWLRENPGHTHYPGIKPLPADAHVLSSFFVPAGTFTGTIAACPP